MTTWEDVPLFDLGTPRATPEPVDTAQRRRTRRQRALIAVGTHPATRRPIVRELGTCGTCARVHRYGERGRGWWKCELHPLGESHSAASDIRISWPACDQHNQREAQ